MRLLSAFLILFLSATMHGYVTAARSNFGDQSVQGYGFILKSQKYTYFISPAHVLGGASPRALNIKLEKLIYRSALKDLAIYQISDAPAQILLKYDSACNGICVEKPVVQNKFYKKFAFSNIDFAFLPNEHKTSHLKSFDKNSLFENEIGRVIDSEDGKANAVGLRFFNVQTEEGFSGAPVLDRFDRFRGMILRYDPLMTRTYALSEDVIFAILTKYEQTTNTSVDEDGAIFTNAGLKYTDTIIARKGGDSGDGGKSASEANNLYRDGMTESGISIDGRNVAYFKLPTVRLYPNRTSALFLQSHNIDLKKWAVFTDDPHLNYSTLLDQDLKASKTEAFEFPINAEPEDQTIGVSVLSLTSNKISISVPLKKPTQCNLQLNFNEKGVLEGHESMMSVLKITACGEPLTIDLRDFYFLNIDYLALGDIATLSQTWQPRLKIKFDRSGKTITLDFEIH